jgi:hypothetical protein
VQEYLLRQIAEKRRGSQRLIGARQKIGAPKRSFMIFFDQISTAETCCRSDALSLRLDVNFQKAI